VSPAGSILVGAGAAAICYVFVTLVKPKAGYDDSLDVFGVHGVGGMWGALATGIFIAELPDGVTWGGQVWIQLVSVIFVAVFATALTFVILSILKPLFGGLRVDEEDEHEGLDLSEHSESAYQASGQTAG
jgi:Amt family ammonium transporter